MLVASRAPGLLLALVLALALPGALAGDVETRRYAPGAVWAACSPDEPDGQGAACFTLEGETSGAVTLVDDAFGVVPSAWAAFSDSGALLARGDLCETTAVALPPGSAVLFVHVDTTIRAREGCPLPTQPVYSSGTITFAPN